MDILQEHLVRARSSGGVFAQSVASPPWGIVLRGTRQLTIHIVVKGRAYIWTDDHSEAQELVPGDIALILGGPKHYLAHSPDAACIPHEQFLTRPTNNDISG